MPLTVLSDDDVRNVLFSLAREDIMEMQQSLADALHYYSTATEEESSGGCASMQPLRTVLARQDGQTTLFMPASSDTGLGVKIVSLQEQGKTKADHSENSSLAKLSIYDRSGSASTTSTASSFEAPASMQSAQTTSPRGSLTLLDKNGFMRALVNAEEITAFRTALASCMLFKKRTNVHDVTVFGAGKQAYWHIRLALMLRGPEIHHVNIINRSFERAHQLIETLYNPQQSPSKAPGASRDPPPELTRPKFSILTPGHTEYERLLKETVRQSSVIFCTTPSVSPLFPASYLISNEGRKKGRYIAAIGSYKPHMLELHPDILRHAVAPDDVSHHKHHILHRQHAKQGGAVIVDSVEACLKEAGEVIQAGLQGHEVVEIGELVMLKRDAEERRRNEAISGKVNASSLDSGGVELCNNKKGGKKTDMDETEKGLMEWLERGNVIYKSVGLGLMDVVVGMELVRLAGEKDIGIRIQNF